LGNQTPNKNQSGANATPLARKSGFLQSRNSKFFIGGAIIVVVLGVLMFNSMQSTTVYYVTVGELQAKAATAQTEDVRVAAKVVNGTINWDAATSTGTFKVTDTTGATMPVVYQGLMPDTFKDGSDVVVEGKLDTAGAFKAHTLLSKCPSKYEPAK
jgi:cytochrome c-type biogenesis protein CcmE